MFVYPPSPALSVCDSLDGVDLDALLDAQGPLSRFATPPLNKTPTVEVEGVLEDAFDEDEYPIDCMSPHSIPLSAIH